MQRSGFLALLCVCALPAYGLDGVVGRVPGSFDVSSSGSARYQIPIDVAAGINGLRPELGLAYNSAGGDGIVGVNWALGGLSEVTRCAKTLAQDLEIRGVRYEASDRFCLDGQRLVTTSGTYGADATVYKTELDGYSRIVSSGSTGGTGQPTSFTVQRPNGLKYTYGSASDARILTPGAAVIRTWALDKIADKYGNRILYHYGQNSTTGEHWPTEVRWTVRSDQAEANARYSVVFAYRTQARVDLRSGYAYGAGWARTKLLETVKYYAGGSLIHTYTLAFKPGVLRSQLESVKLSGPTTELPATQFTWSADATGLGPTLNSQTTAEFATAAYGDFDNDGDTDVFMTTATGLKVMRTEDSGVCCAYTAPASTNVTGYTTGRPVLMELNGDGRIDILGYINNGLTAFVPAPLPSLPAGVSALGGPAAIDINGDGLDELAMVAQIAPNPPTVWIYPNVGGVLQTPVATNAGMGASFSWSGDDDRVSAADFDGDGRQDLLLKGAGFVWQAWRSDTTLTGAPTFTDYGRSNVLGGHTGEYALTADVNGDGLTDVVIVGGSTIQPSASRVAISKGKHGPAAADSLFANTVAADIEPGLQWMLRVMDYDGDGRDDILQPMSFRPGCETTASWCVWRSNGSTYAAANYGTVGGPAPQMLGLGEGTRSAAQVAVVDINADGHRDFLVTTTAGGAWKFRLHTGPASRVTAIADGLGNSTGITYAPLSQVTVNTGTALPNTRFVRDGRLVVTAFSTADGLGSTYNTAYAYTGALRDRYGRGFLGFKRLALSDSRTNNPDLETEYRQDFPYVGRIEKQTLLRPGTTTPVRIIDPIWTEYTSDPDSNPATANPHAVYASREKTDEYEVDANSNIVLTTDRTVLSWNNTHNAAQVSKVEMTSPQQSGFMYRTTITNTFDAGPASTSVWCLGLVTSESVLRENPSGSATRGTGASWDQAKCSPLTETVGTTGPAAEQLKTTYQFDAFGRVQWVTEDNGTGTLAPVNQDRKAEFTYADVGEDARPSLEKAYLFGEATHDIQRSWNVAFGLLASETDARDQVTSWQYDEFGRLRSEVLPIGVTNTLFYLDCATFGANCFAAKAKYRVATSSTNNAWSQTDYDQLGRVVGAASLLGDDRVSRQQISYNNLGQVVGTTVPAHRHPVWHHRRVDL